MHLMDLSHKCEQPDDSLDVLADMVYSLSRPSANLRPRWKDSAITSLLHDPFLYDGTYVWCLILCVFCMLMSAIRVTVSVRETQILVGGVLMSICEFGGAQNNPCVYALNASACAHDTRQVPAY
jgi:hypothetical protein